MVEPPEAENPNSLPQERIDDIANVLATIVRTSIDKDENPNLTDEAIEQKIAVSVQPFEGKVSFDEPTTTTIPVVDLCHWRCTSGHYRFINLLSYSC